MSARIRTARLKNITRKRQNQNPKPNVVTTAAVKTGRQPEPVQRKHANTCSGNCGIDGVCGCCNCNCTCGYRRNNCDNDYDDGCSYNNYCPNMSTILYDQLGNPIGQTMPIVSSSCSTVPFGFTGYGGLPMPLPPRPGLYNPYNFTPPSPFIPPPPSFFSQPPPPPSFLPPPICPPNTCPINY